LREEALEDSKRIKFYEEQMVQLAKMTDATYFEKALEDHQKNIAQLYLKLSKYENPLIATIPEENHN